MKKANLWDIKTVNVQTIDTQRVIQKFKRVESLFKGIIGWVIQFTI